MGSPPSSPPANPVTTNEGVSSHNAVEKDPRIQPSSADDTPRTQQSSDVEDLLAIDYDAYDKPSIFTEADNLHLGCEIFASELRS